MLPTAVLPINLSLLTPTRLETAVSHIVFLIVT
nr:MAG TPA: hypothetical protein [Caudoviricetes sp.]